MRVVFYDDREDDYSNNQLVKDLRKTPNLKVAYVNKVDIFESTVQRQSADIYILDIMGPDSLTEFDNTDKKVPCDFVGIELLRRIRDGHYNNPKDSPVLMRSARGETFIHDMCMNYGANGYFDVGDNQKLISFIKDLINRS